MKTAKPSDTRRLVLLGLLTAIEAIFCFTPLGSLPALGPIVATLMMTPVVITAILLGPKAGTLMGFLSGLFSFIVWTFTPPSPVVAFVFTPFYQLGEFSGSYGSLLICFVPRTLAGTVAGLVYRGMSRAKPAKNVLCFSIGSALGSLTNTFGVLGGIWLFFGEQYSSVAGGAILVLIGMTILTSGIPEAIVNAIISSAVCKPLKMIMKKST